MFCFYRLLLLIAVAIAVAVSIAISIAIGILVYCYCYWYCCYDSLNHTKGSFLRSLQIDPTKTICCCVCCCFTVIVANAITGTAVHLIFYLYQFLVQDQRLSFKKTYRNYYFNFELFWLAFHHQFRYFRQKNRKNHAVKLLFHKSTSHN